MEDEIREAIVGTASESSQQRPPTGSKRAKRPTQSKPGGAAKKEAVGLNRGRKGTPATRAARKHKQSDDAKASEEEEAPASRRELLEKALRIIAADLDIKGGNRPTNTIANLVQLLKLDRSFKEDEEQPHEIRVVWEEKRDETFDDSAGNSLEALPET